jgi:glyoxylase-like metal-dependent hydrolase (beta-lactamase superfamily II)
MLKKVAEGVLVHESEFISSNAVVVQGASGVLLVDPGLTRAEMESIADDLRELGQSVVAGFSTHPDWDHVLWHPAFGDVPRYGTALGAAAMRELLANPGLGDLFAEMFPPEYVDDIPTELFGQLTALPVGATEVPWDGPTVRILEHRGHATGHAALFVEGSGVLIAGDMLSDILMPFLDLEAADPVGDYLAGLALLEEPADDVRVVIPGHGSVGDASQLRSRIALDRAYVNALREGRDVDDSRIGPDAPLDWLSDVHDWQRQSFAERSRG